MKFTEKTDLLVTIYLIFGVLSGVLISGVTIDGIVLLKWIALWIVYIMVRTIPNKSVILYAITIVGVVQSIVAIGQQTGYLASNHNMFDITGFMGNPGQLGGFQSIVFVLSISLFIKRKESPLIRYLIGFAIALIGYSLLIADSRAGWLAAAVGLASLSWKQIKDFIAGHKIALIPIIAITFFCAILLFNYRSDSANSRLLIWRVCIDMIAEKPILGHGVSTFNSKYMLYQADYFTANPNSKLAMVADNAAYPYNELLHILIEQGILGTLLFLLILVLSFRAANRTIRGALAALLVFSMFSYPSYVNLLLIMFPILFGLAGKKDLFSGNRRMFYRVGVPMVMFFALLFYREYKFHNEARAKSMQLMSKENEASIRFLSENFDHIKQYPQLNNIYASLMAKYPLMADESKFKMIIPLCESYCSIGNIYLSLNNYDKAEEYYITASHMIPTRLMPNYHLWELYVKSGDTEKSVRIANKLLNQNLKVENTLTIRAKAKVRNYIDSISK